MLLAQIARNQDDPGFPFKDMKEVLPGTKLLTLEGDLSVKMLMSRTSSLMKNQFMPE